MVWCEITSIETSMYDNSTKIIYFNYYGTLKHIIVTKKVLKYLKLESIDNIKEVFVVKTYIKENAIFLLKKVK